LDELRATIELEDFNVLEDEMEELEIDDDDETTGVVGVM